MPLRPPAGFISAFFDPLNNPNAPTIGTATAGDTTASVTFTPPTNVGGSAISGYGARSTPDNVTATAAASPISVTGLTNGTAYTFAVWAINSYGPSAFSGASNSVTPAALIGLWGGGLAPTSTNTISQISISTTGNATDFGDLTVAREQLAGLGSATRGVFGGGNSSNVMDYITFTSSGNATDFGDLNGTRRNLASLANSTRGVWAGGDLNTGATSSIVYITIATTGNTTTFGNLTVDVGSIPGGCGSSTRGVIGGGRQGSPVSAPINVMGYITIATTGNASNFGDLQNPVRAIMSCSSATRGIFAGGDDDDSILTTNIINYITIASTGNASDFGDLTQKTVYGAACSSSTRGVFGGGGNNSKTNILAYITISTTGNATDFGDLPAGVSELGAASNCHGGL